MLRNSIEIMCGVNNEVINCYVQKLYFEILFGCKFTFSEQTESVISSTLKTFDLIFTKPFHSI